MKKAAFSNSLSLFLMMSLISSVGFSQTLITDGEDLQETVNAAKPGDTVIVKNGSYHDFESSFTTSGTAENLSLIHI